MRRKSWASWKKGKMLKLVRKESFWSLFVLICKGCQYWEKAGNFLSLPISLRSQTKNIVLSKIPLKNGPFFTEMEKEKSSASLYTIDHILTIKFSNNHYLGKYFKKVNKSHIAALSSFFQTTKKCWLIL